MSQPQAPASFASDQPALRTGDRVLVLVNPAAWRTHDGAWKAALSAALSPGIAADWMTPPRVDDVPDIIRRASADGVRAVIVAGGDGTVSRSIEALAGTDLLLGILPLGTGNDLARELGVPTEIPAAIERLLTGHERTFDLVSVNGRPFATVGLIGITAGSALRVADWQASGGWRRALGRALGRQAYRVSGALSLLTPRRAWRACRTVIDTPGSPTSFDRDAYGYFIANGRRLGSGLVLPVDANTRDGRFEVCVVRRVGRLKLMVAFACLTQGWPIPAGVLEVHPATFAVVEWPEPTMFSADGEALVEDRRFTLEIRPGALRVIA